MNVRVGIIAAGIVCALTSAGASAFSNLYVFGDSLSDSGNNDLIFKTVSPPNGFVTPVPISGNDFIPEFPYASGHYTNGDVWAQNFAAALGLPTNPSLAGGTDFAYGGARTSGATPLPAIHTLVQQKDDFLAAHPHIAGDALYVVQGGGNNARDALSAIGQNPQGALQTIQLTARQYADDVGGMVQDLESAGARNIVVWNVPDIGKSPALLSLAAGPSFLATSVAQSMNAALTARIGSDSRVTLFDFFGVVDEVALHPAQFKLGNVTDACARLTPCDPSQFLFWDGIHPTSAGHRILSDAMLQLVPEPSTYACLIAGLLALACSLRASGCGTGPFIGFKRPYRRRLADRAKARASGIVGWPLSPREGDRLTHLA